MKTAFVTLSMITLSAFLSVAQAATKCFDTIQGKSSANAIGHVIEIQSASDIALIKSADHPHFRHTKQGDLEIYVYEKGPLNSSWSLVRQGRGTIIWDATASNMITFDGPDLKPGITPEEREALTVGTVSVGLNRMVKLIATTETSKQSKVSVTAGNSRTRNNSYGRIYEFPFDSEHFIDREVKIVGVVESPYTRQGYDDVLTQNSFSSADKAGGVRTVEVGIVRRVGPHSITLVLPNGQTKIVRFLSNEVVTVEVLK